jgi:type VI protein secretion system component Hcp
MLLGSLSPASAQSRLVLRIEGPPVNGECKLSGYQNWIDVASFGQEVQHLIGAQPDTGYFSVVKELDRATVPLAFHAVSGTVFDKVSLELLGRIQDTYAVEYRVELTAPRIIMVKPDLSGATRQEGVVFDGYTAITWTYYYRRADGSLIGIVTRTVPGS